MLGVVSASPNTPHMDDALIVAHDIIVPTVSDTFLFVNGFRKLPRLQPRLGHIDGDRAVFRPAKFAAVFNAKADCLDTCVQIMVFMQVYRIFRHPGGKPASFRKSPHPERVKARLNIANNRKLILLSAFYRAKVFGKISTALSPWAEIGPRSVADTLRDTN